MPLALDEAMCYHRGAMSSSNLTLLPHEAAAVLEIRLARVAQLLRTGILPYTPTADFPLIERLDVIRVHDLFPELIAFFREEKRCANGEEIGEDALDPSFYQRPSTVALMRCVNVAQPTVPIGQ